MRVRIDPGAADFPYQQLAAGLWARITDGTYPPGSKLPTNVELVAETGLSPMTVRRAMRLLESKGVVRVVPGRGTFVRERDQR